MMAELRIGTCSWKFPSWEGLVYSSAKGTNYLAEYAERYDSVEIDQWFWSRFDLGQVNLPRPEDVAGYRASVPDTFRFTVKAPNSVTLTHLYRQDKSAPLVANPSFLNPRLMEVFCRHISPLGDVLGPIMYQFEYLNRQKMASQDAFQRQFSDFARHVPREYTYGLEVRNARYMNASYFGFLLDCGVIPVLLQGYWMPPVWEVYAAQRALIAQHEAVVLRLLGPDREGIEELTGKQWHEIAAPKDEELPHIAHVVHDLLNAGVTVYVNVNNHYEGSAPLTIQRLLEQLDV